MRFPKKITWVVVADGARARIMASSGPGRGLAPALDHDFAAPALPSRDLAADRPGRAHESATATRHAIEPRVDPHRQSKERLAGAVAATLERAAVDEAFDQLVLIAPPETLGNLRAALDGKARDRIVAELAKDLTHQNATAIASQVRTMVNI